MPTRLLIQVCVVVVVLSVVIAGLYLEIVKPFEKQVGRM